MITLDKINTDVTAFWLVVVLLFITLGLYGRPAIEWLLIKMYEFFIQRTSMKL
jgi:hypothetical protein